MIWNWIINIFLLFFLSTSNLPAVTNHSWEAFSLPPSAMKELVAADKAAVLSPDGRFLLFDKNADTPQPIASITKLMTALVFLETNPDWDSYYKIKPADNISGGRLNLFLGDTVNLRDLFLTSLVASDNGATIALVHASGLSESNFIARMNELAGELRLDNTAFTDPIGLSARNVSTAREVALLAKVALEKPEISEAVSRKDYSFLTLEGREKFIESTDYLLFDPAPGELQPLGGKTGYTDLAGYCFVGRFEGPGGEQLIAAVLNSPGRNDRFRESKAVVGWVLDNFFKKSKD